jgi:hypothetical protein
LDQGVVIAGPLWSMKKEFRAVSPVDFRDKPIEHAASEPLAQRMLHGMQDKTCAA